MTIEQEWLFKMHRAHSPTSKTFDFKSGLALQIYFKNTMKTMPYLFKSGILFI